ncbi:MULTISPECIES: MFS transporter [Bradyrhizobium]|uniref:MFS transporter n=1 Tax=Bradyrhizobium TaxID=374 RepID=UPI0004846C12|nr:MULTISPECIES: MFS transporter [Bradyrhizobium]MCS3444798.1 MFS family permease [Bradyrhizobium elkanii]MCS3564074.1 MFS family permease [Bradyrhizobium elkanii]MCW2146094.1 MFS family permease [Bradyrhizobium elkanii]MCW2354833.1 MFS family permease [Bradyrhizobium elkanii]MCW2378921.1 MFS family permease [Bradyrhizobium elkanii]
MSSITADGHAAPAVSDASIDIGPLEQKHLQYANYRAVADTTEITKTHWHIATANALGWGFDGMDGVIFALISPMVIKEFSLSLPEYRSGMQIALFVGIAGLYFWPWLADRYGRRTLLAVNIALFSLLMPVAAMSPTFAVFVIARSLLFFALNGEWSLGSMLVAETWPARLRGRVISITRSAWCLGATLAGAITGLVAANFGWRIAVMVPGVIALLAIYIRSTCPESPYWVRAQDRKRRISETLARGGTVSAEDSAWFGKAKSVGIRQVFMPDVLPATLVALFVACASTCIYGTVGAWMPLYLSTEKHWSTAEYSLFYVFYGLCGFLGLCLVGWLIDKIGRRRTFIITLIEGAIFMTLWVYSEDRVLLWAFGLAWCLGFLGFWGPSTTLTAEIFPTRIRGAANGVVWAIAYFVGFVLFPFVSIALQQHTGSFALSFLCIPVLMIAMAIGVYLFVPEHTGKELNEIIE